MYAAQSDGGRRIAELGHGGREAFRVQPCGLLLGAVLVDTPLAIGDDQGNEGTGTGDDPERQLDHLEQRAGGQKLLSFRAERQIDWRGLSVDHQHH